MNILDFDTSMEFLEYFKDEKTCVKYFKNIRFKEGEFCPRCNYPKVHRFKNYKRYRCAICKKDFSIKTGTIFEESRISLKKWFVAIYLLSTRKKGISSIELSKQIGVTQKTAWFMDHRIRKAMKENIGFLKGTVETDETYIGGKEKNKHISKRVKGTQGRNIKTKTAVIGMVERGGRVKTNVLNSVTMRSVEKHLIENIQLGSEIHTDDFLGYSQIKKLFTHKSVKHGAGEYVRGDIHSNTAESFWAIFKRTYYGTYHSMSKKHLQSSTDEIAYRWNARKFHNQDVFKNLVKNCKDKERITYKELKNG